MIIYRMKKPILVGLVFLFALQQATWAQTTEKHTPEVCNGLRPLAVGEDKSRGPQVRDEGQQPVVLTLPFTPELIRNLRPIVIQNSAIDTYNHQKDFMNAMMADGWELEIANVNIPAGLSNLDCNTYILGRLKITVFKVSGQSDLISVLKLYTISNEQTVIGHGMLEYFPDARAAMLRFSIHSGSKIFPDRNFRNKGYGTEALAAIMAICANDHIVDISQVSTFQLYFAPEDLDDPTQGVYELLKLARKCGFDENNEFHMPPQAFAQDPLTAATAALPYI